MLVAQVTAGDLMKLEGEREDNEKQMKNSQQPKCRQSTETFRVEHRHRQDGQDGQTQ